MKLVALLLVDVLLFLSAILLALILRGAEALDFARLAVLAPYLLATAVSIIALWPMLGINRSIWRLSRLPDYLRLLLGAGLGVACASLIVFAYDRLESVPRSLPILQAIVGVALLVGARVAARLHYAYRLRRPKGLDLLVDTTTSAHKRVLVVGLGSIAELYLRVAAETAGGSDAVVGLLGRTDRHVGRIVAGKPVLGLPEQAEDVIDQLAVHGVTIDEIIVTMKREALGQEALDVLLRLQSTTEIELKFIEEMLGLDPVVTASSQPAAGGVAFRFAEKDRRAIRQRTFWRIKRLIDVAGAAVLIVVLAPVFLVVGVAVAISMGMPVIFWQQRPGRGGRPFRVYKFRTMGAARDFLGRQRTDAERVSAVGSFLRRSRLDELPQLFNILIGDMSFIGPRPLLPRDQVGVSGARLVVRPGLSGWAQVVGGRDIPAVDKAALDVWYVQNASFALDLEILVRTVGIVLFGERTDEGIIERIWRDLYTSGVCSKVERTAA
ncbi:MAG: sugar transferase [Hyphomicrobiaceae bacterium]